VNQKARNEYVVTGTDIFLSVAAGDDPDMGAECWVASAGDDKGEPPLKDEVQ
jgi:hypothetical protein